MFRPFELFVGLRYLRSKRRNRFISFLSLVCIAGLALSLTVLITVVAVMNGFEKEVQERLLGAVAHIVISVPSGTDWQQLADVTAEHPRVLGVAPYITGQAMVIRNRQPQGVIVHGVEPQREHTVSDYAAQLRSGKLQDLTSGGRGIIVGKTLAESLGVDRGDAVTLLLPRPGSDLQTGLPLIKRFSVTGVFETGLSDFDENVVLLHIEDGIELFNPGRGVTGVRVKLDDSFAVGSVQQELAQALPARAFMYDWRRNHRNFFLALAHQKRTMSIILLLIVVVAAFNLLSAIVMMVKEKESAIAILRTLGATPLRVMIIFVIQGTVIGLIGTALGVLGGVALAANVEIIVPAVEQAFELDLIPHDVYPISDLPSDPRWPEVFGIGAMAFALSVLATVYPSWRAARTRPAEALRYE
ncbi:MAG: lipoprotein-releasing ABC transporter permease subunit [Gammaproteobacteria bacterium]